MREVHKEPCHFNHTAGLVHNHHAAASDDRADLFEAVEIKRQIQMLRSQTAARRTADLNGFEFAAVSDAAADFKNDVLKRGSHRDFDKAGVCNVSGESEGFGSRACFRAYGAEPFCALGDDRRNVCVSFDVVQNGRLVEKSVLDRARRFRPRHAALAFDGSRQRRAFAADERARALIDM